MNANVNKNISGFLVTRLCSKFIIFIKIAFSSAIETCLGVCATVQKHVVNNVKMSQAAEMIISSFKQIWTFHFYCLPFTTSISFDSNMNETETMVENTNYI